ncbi:MAG: SLOG family protein [Mycetocola sp.]
MSENTFHIALTGHRPNKLAGYNLNVPFYAALSSWLIHIVETGLQKHEHLTLHSGLALGADTVWSHVILAVREQYPDRVAFVAEVPVMTQSSQWPSARDQKFWQKQIDTADLVNVYAESYSPRAMQLRNEGMLRPAQLVLAVWDGSTGGTGHAVRFAEKQGIPVFRMTPADITARAALLHTK